MSPIDRRKKYIVLLIVIAAITAGGAISWFQYTKGTAAVLLSISALLVAFPVLQQLPRIVSGLRALAGRMHWWHLAWALMFLSGLVFRTRDIAAIYANPWDFWAIFRIGLMVVVALILLGQLMVRDFNWLNSLFRGIIGLLSAYSLISILSTFWSTYPTWTLYRSFEYFVDVWLAAATIAAVRREADLAAMFDWSWILVLILTASAWVGALFSPGQAIIPGVGILGPQLRGVIPVQAANGVGELGALLAVMALTRLLFPTALKRVYSCLFIAALGTLLLSQSRSPLMGFLLALPLILFTARRIRVGLLLALLLPAVLFVTNLGDLLWQFFLRGQGQELFATLSGRMDWWRYSLPILRERPLWGYGAYAGGRFIVLAELDVTLSSSIHNTWLEVLLGTGLLGLLPLLAAFCWVWVLLIGRRPAWGASTQRMHAEAIGIFSVLSVRSIFTANLIWHPPLMFLLVLVYAQRLRSGRHTNRLPDGSKDRLPEHRSVRGSPW